MRRVRERAGVFLGGALATLGVACGSPGLEMRDPIDYLRVGVDPRDEAQSTRRSLSREGYDVHTVVEADDVFVLNALRPRDGATAVRVVTRAGIALGLDAPDRAHPARDRVEGLPAEVSGRDLLGDGNLEVLLRVDGRDRAAPCIAVVRIDAQGRAVELPLPTRRVQVGACAEEAEVIVRGDGERVVALLVVARYALASVAEVASVAIPLRGHEGEFVLLGPDAPGYFAARIAERERNAERVRRGSAEAGGEGASGPDELPKLAVEGGVLAVFAGAARDDVDALVTRLSEGAGLEARAEARALVAAVWRRHREGEDIDEGASEAPDA